MERLLIVKNVEREGPGLLRDVLAAHGLAADVIEMARGDEIPALAHYAGVVVLGGPASANDGSPAIHAQMSLVREVLEKGLPYLGICLGHQLLGKVAGGDVHAAGVAEVGFVDPGGSPHEITLTAQGKEDPLFQHFPETFPTFQLHGEEVRVGRDAVVLATGRTTYGQAIRVGRQAYGVQFHAEVMPETLSVWVAQDPMLSSFTADQLQHYFGERAEQFIAIGRQLFSNFLVASGLIHAVDLQKVIDARPASVETT